MTARYMFGLIENADVQDVGDDKATAMTGTQRHAMTQRPAHGVRDTNAGEQLTTILFDMMKMLSMLSERGATTTTLEATGAQHCWEEGASEGFIQGCHSGETVLHGKLRFTLRRCQILPFPTHGPYA